MEIWKDIIGYEGIYQVSNLGRVKSLNYNHTNKTQLLKQGKDSSGYFVVSLYLSGNKTTKKVHQLVAIAFLNHVPCGFELVINHKDLNRLNNRANNLEIVTNRENSNKKHLKSSSQYTGVGWHKRDCKWMACIRINGRLKHLGYFINEYDAHLAYQKALSEI